MKRYDPKTIEPKWQKIWEDTQLYRADDTSSKPKIYATPMLPYPSGAGLHIGHVRNYAISDTVARYYRQTGHSVLSTIAWDAFGLPAENYAIKTGTPPAESTAKNIAYFKQQVQRVGMSVDWSREFNTSDPEYYKWTQWVFSFLYKRGLAYQAEKSQWWCENCKTVLADEQVIAGKCWRHDGADDPLVTKKSLKQWFFKITDYADEILEATDALNWPEKIKTMQKNWIGKSKGALVKFELESNVQNSAVISSDSITVFTTRPDTLYGATFLVLAPEHELINSITLEDRKKEVESYQGEALKKDDIQRQASKDKTGVFTGSYAINPLNGEKMPIWIADYVLTGYGTGAIMAVPAHDQRDNDFAKKYNLPIVEVIKPVTGTPQVNPEYRKSIVAIVRNPKTNKYLSINWGHNGGGNLFVGGGRDENEDPVDAAKREIVEETGYKNVRLINQTTTEIEHHYFAVSKNVARKIDCYGLYFELINEETEEVKLEQDEQGKFKVEWISESDVATKIQDELHRTCFNLLVENQVYSNGGRLINSAQFNGLTSKNARLQIVNELAKLGAGEEKTTYKIRDWLISRQRYWGSPIPIIHCAEHGAVLVPEDQLPVRLPVVEHYAPDGSNHSVLAAQKDWVDVFCPTCGKPSKRETDTMDGYVCSTWYLHRYTDAKNDQKAFSSEKANHWFPLDFYFGGDHAVAHLLYIRFLQRVFVAAGLMSPETIEPVKKLVFNGYINAEDGSKMSKSKGNTVDPMEVIDAGYGADALRVFELFIAPYEQDTPWNTKGVPGTYRFLNRLWVLTQEFLEATSDEASVVDSSADNRELLRVVHKAIKKVTDDLESLSFNTAISAMMECVNSLYKIKQSNGFSAAEQEWRFALESLTQLLAPFAPHITEELWLILGHEDSVHVDHWPVADEKYLQSDTMKLAVQVNGKVRAEILVAADETEEAITALARQQENVIAHLEGKDPKKIIYVKNRLVSIVV